MTLANAVTPGAPPEYGGHPLGFSIVCLLEDLPFNLGSAIRHLWLASILPSGTAIEDLRTAAWYLRRENEREQRLVAASAERIQPKYSAHHELFISYVRKYIDNMPADLAMWSIGLDVEIAAVIISWFNNDGYHWLADALELICNETNKSDKKDKNS